MDISSSGCCTIIRPSKRYLPQTCGAVWAIKSRWDLCARMAAFEPALIITDFETDPDLFPIKILANIGVKEELSTPY
jgi:hypothetical protein